MQSFDTKPDETPSRDDPHQTVTVGRADDISAAVGVRFELPDGNEVAVFNVNGEYYAIDNFCPHKGALLSDGQLCGHIVECSLHGWQFDVRTGECLTVPERLRTYKVTCENGEVKIGRQ